MIAAAGMMKSSCSRSGCFSISLTTIRTSCSLVTPSGGQEASLPARSPSRAISVWKLLAVVGPPRSEAKTCGPAGSCWRCKRRSARISLAVARSIALAPF